MSAVVPEGGGQLRRVLEGWDALIETWGLSPIERSALLGAIPSGDPAVPGSYGAEAAEIRMRLLVEFAPVVRQVHRSDVRIRAWLRRANPHLGGQTPIEAMASSPEWVRWMIRAMGTAS